MRKKQPTARMEMITLSLGLYGEKRQNEAKSIKTMATIRPVKNLLFGF
jgi:hypothetical protein